MHHVVLYEMWLALATVIVSDKLNEQNSVTRNSIINLSLYHGVNNGNMNNINLNDYS